MDVIVEQYFDLNVRHFHEKLTREHGLTSSRRCRPPSPRSWLSASTWTFSVSRRASASSDGISTTQGPHQVAQRLTSTGRPRKSASRAGRPKGSWNAVAGAGVPACERSSRPVG